LSVRLRLNRDKLASHAPTLASYLLTLILVTIGVAFAPYLLSRGNLDTQLVFAAFIGIAALGQTLVILGGGIDLSVPWVLAFGAIQLGNFAGLPPWLAIALVIAFGCLIGVLNGLGVVVLGVSPIIMTLAVGGLVQGYLLETGRGNLYSVVPDLASKLASSSLGPIPFAVVIWAVLALATGLLLSRTITGRRIYAVGTNDRTARLSGVNVSATRVLTYVVSGGTAAFAGILLAGYLGAAYPTIGAPYLFGSIAAVLLGGVAVEGGHGSYWGTIAGALTLTLLSALTPVLNLSQGGLKVIYGAIILGGLYLARLGLRLASPESG
jgi:ribose transport system permease protein